MARHLWLASHTRWERIPWREYDNCIGTTQLPGLQPSFVARDVGILVCHGCSNSHQHVREQDIAKDRVRHPRSSHCWVFCHPYTINISELFTYPWNFWDKLLIIDSCPIERCPLTKCLPCSKMAEVGQPRRCQSSWVFLEACLLRTVCHSNELMYFNSNPIH